MSLSDEGYVEQHVEEENYFISMTDMMVGLVFIFLILIMYYALQYRQTTDELTSADRTRSVILVQLQDYLKDHGVKVEIDTRTGVLRLPDNILFDSGNPHPKPEGVAALGQLANGLMQVLPCYADGVPRPAGCPASTHRVEATFIEGHTDSDPLNGSGGLTDNWDLSVERATNTYRQLIAERPELGNFCLKTGSTCSAILSVSGYGDTRPVAAGDDDASKQRNRRIDIRILMETPKPAETAAIESQLGSGR
jgi:chemotaxis protein MotB